MTLNEEICSLSGFTDIYEQQRVNKVDSTLGVATFTTTNIFFFNLRIFLYLFSPISSLHVIFGQGVTVLNSLSACNGHFCCCTEDILFYIRYSFI